MEPEIIAASVSPNGNVQAFVEQDEHTAYFYLRGDPDFGVRSCWVRNLHEAPAELDVEGMKAGRAPLLPRDCCVNPLGRLPLESAALRIVWFEEGVAAALLEREDILAVVPAWGGLKGFEGYARDCRAVSPLAWPLPKPDVFSSRVRRAAAWWQSWDDGHPWAPYRDAQVKALEASLGPVSQQYAIGKDEWPPAMLLQFAHDGAVVLVTCGMGLRPQPRVELADDGAAFRRVELAMALDPELVDAEDGRVLSWLAAQSRFPWAHLTWLGSGHTMPCNGVPGSPRGTSFEALLWLKDPPGAPKLLLPEFRGDPVSLLWGVPITAAEQALGEKSGSAALAAKLAAQGCGAVHRDRLSVVES